MKTQLPDAAPDFPHVRLFCPNCGEPTRIKTMMPLMFVPSTSEITHSCRTCGTDTKVQIRRLPRGRRRRA